MATWLLEAFNTDRRYSDDVRYRAYTSSKRRAEAFRQIPKIQFTDSGHGIVFAATELPRGTRKQEPRYDLDEYVRMHMAELMAAPPKAKRPSRAEMERLQGLLADCYSQFAHLMTNDFAEEVREATTGESLR